ncbi:hypothetical protein Ddc_08311 [Ditylenchus destructor]|nr:hypothetical protein Ddc_08311 [Ditylenchus destructor]
MYLIAALFEACCYLSGVLLLLKLIRQMSSIILVKWVTVADLSFFANTLETELGINLPFLKRCAKWIGSGINGSEGSIAMRLTPNCGFRLSFLPFKFSVC